MPEDKFIKLSSFKRSIFHVYQVDVLVSLQDTFPLALGLFVPVVAAAVLGVEAGMVMVRGLLVGVCLLHEDEPLGAFPLVTARLIQGGRDDVGTGARLWHL